MALLGGPTSSPTCVVAGPTMPSMGEMSWVKPVDPGGIDRGRGRCTAASRGLDLGLGRLHPGLGRRRPAPCSQIGLGGVIEVLLGDGLLFGERDVTVLIELGFVLIRFGLESCASDWTRLGLGGCALACASCPWDCSRGLKGPRIDLEQQLPFPTKEPSV